MKKNIYFKFFNEYRRSSIHEGQYFVNFGKANNGCMSWSFNEIKNMKFNDEVFIICKRYFMELLELVFECYEEFKGTMSEKWHFTQNNFEMLKKTISKEENELGFPSDWTKLNGSKEELPLRWTALRRNAIGCEINHLFKMYLNKSFQEPDDT